MFHTTFALRRLRRGAEVKLLIHAAVITAFFIGSDIVLNHGTVTRALNAKVLHVSKEFQREVTSLVD